MLDQALTVAGGAEVGVVADETAVVEGEAVAAFADEVVDAPGPVHV
jgi:hypothetical protein